MLARLIYKSQRIASCTEAEIQKILESAQSNNSKKDVTGILLFDPSHFIQYLEGPSEVVSALYDHIKTDPRHKEVRMISYGPIKKREFPEWAMAGKALNSKKINFLTQLSAKEKSDFEAILGGKEVPGDRALSILTKFAQA